MPWESKPSLLPRMDDASELTSAPLTKSQINRAGRVLRRWLRKELVPPEKVEAAFAVVREFRASHQYPLLKANMGLRSAVQAERCGRLEVSQRLKRMDTILDKLLREPSMGLAEMQDIGGCRAVVDSTRELRRVERRLRKNREVLGSKDYIAHPKESGYRAVHVIVGYQGQRYTEDDWWAMIEIQLRTTVMHEWAIAVERLSGRLREDLKGGRGPRQVLDWLEAVSEAMALEEGAVTVPETLQLRIKELRLAALPYIGGRP